MNMRFAYLVIVTLCLSVGLGKGLRTHRTGNNADSVPRRGPSGANHRSARCSRDHRSCDHCSRDCAPARDRCASDRRASTAAPTVAAAKCFSFSVDTRPCWQRSPLQSARAACRAQPAK